MRSVLMETEVARAHPPDTHTRFSRAMNELELDQMQLEMWLIRPNSTHKIYVQKQDIVGFANLAGLNLSTSAAKSCGLKAGRHPRCRVASHCLFCARRRCVPAQLGAWKPPLPPQMTLGWFIIREWHVDFEGASQSHLFQVCFPQVFFLLFETAVRWRTSRSKRNAACLAIRVLLYLFILIHLSLSFPL